MFLAKIATILLPTGSFYPLLHLEGIIGAPAESEGNQKFSKTRSETSFGPLLLPHYLADAPIMLRLILMK
jgi:hypothetical protein